MPILHIFIIFSILVISHWSHLEDNVPFHILPAFLPFLISYDQKSECSLSSFILWPTSQRTHKSCLMRSQVYKALFNSCHQAPTPDWPHPHIWRILSPLAIHIMSPPFEPCSRLIPLRKSGQTSNIYNHTQYYFLSLQHSMPQVALYLSAVAHIYFLISTGISYSWNLTS